MDDRAIFEEYETQLEHVEDLEASCAGAALKLEEFYDRALEVLRTKYSGKALRIGNRVYFLDSSGEMLARDLVEFPDQPFSEDEIDVIMGADDEPDHCCGNCEGVDPGSCAMNSHVGRSGYGHYFPPTNLEAVLREVKMTDGRTLRVGFGRNGVYEP